MDGAPTQCHPFLFWNLKFLNFNSRGLGLCSLEFGWVLCLDLCATLDICCFWFSHYCQLKFALMGLCHCILVQKQQISSVAHKSRHNAQPNSNEHSPRPLEPKFQISNFKTKMGDTGWGHQQNWPFWKTTKSEHLTDTEKFRRYFLKCARILDFVVFIETKKYFLKWTIHLSIILKTIIFHWVMTLIKSLNKIFFLIGVYFDHILHLSESKISWSYCHLIFKIKGCFLWMGPS